MCAAAACTRAHLSPTRPATHSHHVPRSCWTWTSWGCGTRQTAPASPWPTAPPSPRNPSWALGVGLCGAGGGASALGTAQHRRRAEPWLPHLCAPQVAQAGVQPTAAQGAVEQPLPVRQVRPAAALCTAALHQAAQLCRRSAGVLRSAAAASRAPTAAAPVCFCTQPSAARWWRTGTARACRAT